ncbi:hypothetical protein CRYUN_Cryun01aG0144700 [Craigia yunnanensis]
MKRNSFGGDFLTLWQDTRISTVSVSLGIHRDRRATSWLLGYDTVKSREVLSVFLASQIARS